MSNIHDDQIESWLKKLERESWQLELLVSAFTIFLLIGANSAFDEFIVQVQYEYNFSGSALAIIFIFLILIQKSILALTISLIIHLMLRGFWIGAIGLRSVQSSIDFGKLNYNEFFTDRLKKKVISLDRMVIMLDEICSVIFAFSFLLISILIAFGMYLSFVGVFGVAFSAIINTLPAGGLQNFAIILIVILFLFLLLIGVIYMIDYFSLGFFKKIRWFSKFYYPFYRLLNFITLSGLSRSIYYYLISKFSKKRIRFVYGIVGVIVFAMMLFSFDQYQYFPDGTNPYTISADVYDDQRPDDQYINTISINSNFIDQPHFQVFLRYDPSDNILIKANCPEFQPLKDDGLNWKLRIESDGPNFHITGRDYSDEDFSKLLECHQSIYQIQVNDSIYTNLKFHFYTHPHKKQKGLLTTIPTSEFLNGENKLIVKKISIDSVGARNPIDYAQAVFWYNQY
ncbi:hypothetical protein SAMN05421640_1115 [Ekhidna lutea]|uniref:Uncharacterized protein n=1 Tax=Ekhidna lutea TaxID=447679 RepID=A0A239H2S0_EKHLU|nr:hypothetical protein [Ekhidna lutea]SNS75677.1 hypothetical protein SAMN05421640_1115 [Ekhidna lutea]